MLLLVVALALGGGVAIGRHVSLRQLDHPLVVAYWFWISFWILGLATSQGSSTVKPLSETTAGLVVASFIAFASGGFAALRVRGALHKNESAQWAASTRTFTPFSVTLAFVVGTLLWVAFAIRTGLPALGPGAEQARVESRYGLGYLVLPAIGFLALSSTALVERSYSAKSRWRHATWVVVGAAGLMIASFGNRGPVLLLLIATSWAALRSTGRTVSWRVLAMGILGAFAVLALTAAVRAGEELTWSLLWSRMRWLTMVNLTNLDQVVQFIPARQDWLGGQSYLLDLSVLLPGRQPNFSEWLKEGLGLSFPGGGITIGLVGESYANWGPVAAVGSCALYGAALVWWRASAWSQRLPASVSVLASLILGAPIQSGLAPTLVNLVLPLLAGFVVMRAADTARPPASYR